MPPLHLFVYQLLICLSITSSYYSFHLIILSSMLSTFIYPASPNPHSVCLLFVYSKWLYTCQHLQIWSKCCTEGFFTLLALLLRSSKVTDRWSHCFPFFAHAFFIAMFKDHTHVLQALSCLLHFVFCRLLCHKLLWLWCFHLLFEQPVLRAWLLSNERRPFELRKPKFWEYYYMKTKLFKSRHLTLSDSVAFHMGLDLNLSTTGSAYNARLAELSALFK